MEDETLPKSFESGCREERRGSDSAVTGQTEADDPPGGIAMKTDSLKVPGANLYYEVRGSGPVLLLVCGGIYDAAGYAGLAGPLADRYTVVTYDRRGNSRSPWTGRRSPRASRSTATTHTAC